MMLMLVAMMSHARETTESELDAVYVASRFTHRQFIRDNMQIPRSNSSHPLKLNYRIQIESIHENFQKMDLYTIESWVDERFRDKTPFTLSGPRIDQLAWIPDTYFLLADEELFHQQAQSLKFNGSAVLLDRKVSISPSCTTEMWKFPFDRVKCKLRISTYGNNNESVELKWAEPKLEFPVHYQSLPELGFNLDKLDTTNYSVRYRRDDFMVLEGSIHIRRLWFIYLMHSYIPATLVVVLSWSISWINQSLAGLPARACMGLTCVLSILTLCRHQKSAAQNAYSGRKFSVLDLYVWISFIFVCAATFLFAVSDFLRPRPEKAEDDTKSESVDEYRMQNNEKVDVITRILLPCSFMTFFMLYWVFLYIIII